MNIDYKMSRSILSTNLPTRTKLVYMALVYHADKDTREAFPSWDLLKQEASIKRSSVNTSLNQLVASGFVTKHFVHGRKSPTYRIIDIKSPPNGLNHPPNDFPSTKWTSTVHQMDPNIRIEHKQLTSASTSVNAEEEEFKSMFDEFWKEYPANCPYKTDKERCERKYAGLLRAQSDPRQFHGIVMKGLERWRKSQRWHDENGRYIRAPLRWLEESSWKDEPPQRVETEEERIARVKAAIPKKLNWALCIECCKHCTGNGCSKGVKVPPVQQKPRSIRPDECEYFSALDSYQASA